MTATNSAGISASRDFIFMIIDDESDLPDDWSRDEVVEALKIGFALPLDRLDAPITRGEFAHLMLVMFYYISDDGISLDIYRGGVVTDCGENNWAAYVMVYYGIMTAENGLFEPGRTITELEAVTSMYKTVAAADPNVFSPGAATSQMINGFRQLGIIDGGGPNSLTESEKLTCRLMLVRLWRIFDCIFI